jgi:ribosomal protein L37E
MATTFVIACPECEKQVKVSDEHVGKKIRCKGCGHIYPVQAADGRAATDKPAGPPAKGKGAPPPPPPAKAGYGVADDEYDPNKYTVTQENNTLPRCPFCAMELSSVDARICLHCGYDTVKRTRPDVKQVYAHSAGELFLWWLPGILAILTMIGLLVWYLFFWGLIEGWLDESWFMDEKGPPTTYLAGMSPGMFRLYHALVIAALYVPLVRFAYKRLIKQNKPPETKIKDELFRQ